VRSRSARRSGRACRRGRSAGTRSATSAARRDVAIELVHDRETKNPAPELASSVVEAAAERGLLLLKSGIYSNCIRVLVPLVINDAELDEALGVWEQALEASFA
jgi:adenosylmethionine-8-amino-7-oxononanoate aminotransferase